MAKLLIAVEWPALKEKYTFKYNLYIHLSQIASKKFDCKIFVHPEASYIYIYNQRGLNFYFILKSPMTYYQICMLCCR